VREARNAVTSACPHASGALAAIDSLERDVASLLRVPPRSLADYRREIDAFNLSQPNAAMLDAIRAYNHQVFDSLHASANLDRATVLDVGASPHGYALEHALDLGAAAYVGIGLDVHGHTIVCGPRGVGELFQADAESLPFAAGTFDAVASLSTFEHILAVDRALAEIRRVLKPGAVALLSFEPIWTCSYGHHLHHFGPVSRLVPPWAHLWWTRDDMRRALDGRWPDDAPLTLEAAVSWTYDEPVINRIGIREMTSLIRSGPLRVEWMIPLRDDVPEGPALDEARSRTGLSSEELTTKGFSVLLRHGG
jgi:SAM-dependent methyltransferase